MIKMRWALIKQNRNVVWCSLHTAHQLCCSCCDESTLRAMFFSIFPFSPHFQIKTTIKRAQTFADSILSNVTALIHSESYPMSEIIMIKVLRTHIHTHDINVIQVVGFWFFNRIVRTILEIDCGEWRNEYRKGNKLKSHWSCICKTKIANTKEDAHQTCLQSLKYSNTN